MTETPKFETRTQRRKRRIAERIERRGRNKRAPEKVIAARLDRAKDRRVTKISKRIQDATSTALGHIERRVIFNKPPRKAKPLSTHAEKRARRRALRAGRT